MKDFSTEQPTEPGTYWYKRPGWSKPECVQVEVVPGDELHVRFHEGHAPYPMSGLPADALWTPAIIAISEFQEEARRLVALLEDPQGLFIWRKALNQTLENLKKFSDMPIDMSK